MTKEELISEFRNGEFFALDEPRSFHVRGKWFVSNIYAFKDTFFTVTKSTDFNHATEDYEFVELIKKTKMVEITNWVVKESGFIYKTKEINHE